MSDTVFFLLGVSANVTGLGNLFFTPTNAPIPLGVTLTVTPRDGAVRVEVCDGNPALFATAAIDDLSEGRRGLRLLDAVCTSWGWRPIDGGKCVWCEL